MTTRRARAFFEIFAGGAACTWALLGGTGLLPPVGYMGGKRRLAGGILAAAGLQPGAGAERVLLVDAGMWGEVWQQVATAPEALAAHIERWEGRDPTELWREIAAAGRPEDPIARAAAYLWLQGRAASCTPVWWSTDGAVTMSRSASGGGGTQIAGPAGALVMADPPRGGDCVVRAATARGDRLVMADKPGRPPQRAQEAHPTDTRGLGACREPKEKGRRSTGSGIMHPSTVAARIRAISSALAGVAVRAERAQLPAADASRWLGTPGDLAGVVALLDPPYVGATRYEATCSRAEVVALAEDYRSLGAMVVVCEAEALPELLARGWHPQDLRAATETRGKPEWLTCSSAPGRLVQPQLRLPLAGR